jgi:hypothetical protein
MVSPESVDPGLLISPAEVRRRLAAGATPTVLDARGRAAYAHSGERIEGDLRAAGRDLTGLIETLGADRTAWLLAYCT